MGLSSPVIEEAAIGMLTAACDCVLFGKKASRCTLSVDASTDCFLVRACGLHGCQADTTMMDRTFLAAVSKLKEQLGASCKPWSWSQITLLQQKCGLYLPSALQVREVRLTHRQL